MEVEGTSDKWYSCIRRLERRKLGMGHLVGSPFFRTKKSKKVVCVSVYLYVGDMFIHVSCVLTWPYS